MGSKTDAVKHNAKVVLESLWDGMGEIPEERKDEAHSFVTCILMSALEREIEKMQRFPIALAPEFRGENMEDDPFHTFRFYAELEACICYLLTYDDFKVPAHLAKQILQNVARDLEERFSE